MIYEGKKGEEKRKTIAKKSRRGKKERGGKGKRKEIREQYNTEQEVREGNRERK